MLAALSIPGMVQAATLGAIDQDGVNLRTGPGTQYSTAGAVALGQSVQVVGFEGDWVKVKAADGSIRYAANWVSVVKMAANEVVWARTTEADLRLRAKPDGTVLATLGNAERVQVLEMNGFWWRIRRANGQEGWSHKSYLKLESTAPEIVPPAGGGTGGTPGNSGTPGTSNPGGAVPTPPSQTPPPPAPAGTVPVLGPLPSAVQSSWGTFQVKALVNSPIYQGRSSVYFDWTGSIKAGETLTYLDSAEGWIKVRTPRGEVGWAPGAQVSITGGGLIWQVAEGTWAAGFAPTATPAPPPSAGPEIRLVRDNDGLRLRATPALNGAILAMLGQNTRLTVLSRQSPWIQVQTEGKVGWVWEEYTIPAASPTPAPTTPVPNAPAQPAANRPSFKLTQIRDGVVQLAITAPGGAIGQPALVGTQLSVPFQTGLTAESGLAVGAAGIRSVKLSNTGLTLDLLHPTDLKVVSQAPGSLVVELRSSLVGLAMQEAVDRSVLKLTLKGLVEPKVQEEPGALSIQLPGASLAPGLVLPPGVTLAPSANGVALRVASKRAYALKRTADGFELHLYKPGLAGKVILLDPGHAGSDHGAQANGVEEAVVNLDVALRLRALLAAKGAVVMMTRTGPGTIYPAGVPAELQPDLLWRTRMANEQNVDLFLSIHHNSGSALATGAEAFYTSTTLNGGRSQQLANLALQAAVNAGMARRYVKDERYYVTRNTDAPNALLEVGYLTNAADAAKVKSAQFQDQVAAQLAKALEQFWAERP
jgi:N-acetylmuramoyl-L-alanine amidase/uncharacterized protein YgiM (DUF1202 family)